MLSLLRIRLHHAIDLWKASQAVTTANDASSTCKEHGASALTAQAIPIKRVGNATSLRYACAIAHQLATSPDQASTIAAQLVDTLRHALAKDPDASFQEALFQEIGIDATATGFIQFEVGDRAIATWLNLRLAHAQPLPPLPTIPLGEAERQRMLQSPAVFDAQHAHARCCSLLRLAHYEALIHLDRLAASPQDWQFRSPATVPWLKHTEELNVLYPVDRALIAQLLDAHDHLFDASRPRTQSSVLRSTQLVAHAFQAFHRAYPLYGGRPEDAAIVVVRLGLLMITQRVLHLLLHDGLKLYPAAEL
ncbi:MAG: hypothetical protein KME45_06790 [Stenomitos rutilans HA7619-LM2]|jgi:hypothetical protein|nr:hypothetical protein [Stenomitos rutilans HA7619-LM2]